MNTQQRAVGMFCLITSFIASFSQIGNGGKGKYLICANDQRFILTDGASSVTSDPRPGSITILDFSHFPPTTQHLESVPCSVIGPPTCVAITPDEKLALITAAMKVDPQDATQQIPDNQITVVDLTSRPPKSIQAIRTGRQPSGISIARDGRLALVALRAEGSVGVLKISDRQVSLAGTIKVCEPEDSIAHIAIAPHGRYALATLHKRAQVIKLSLKDDTVVFNGEVTQVGEGPYCVDFSDDGLLAVVANTMSNTVSVLDLTTHPIKVVDQIYVGVLPEGLDISPDGRWLVVNCMQYSLTKPDDPQRQDHAQLVLLERQSKQWAIRQRLPVDRIPQAAVFSPDGQYVVLASYEQKHLAIYRLDQSRLEDTGIRINTPGQPATLRIAE